MGEQDTQGSQTQTVSQPDSNQVAAPTTDDNQQGGAPATPDTQPKETEAAGAEADAILPDEDEGTGGKPTEGQTEEGKPGQQTEAELSEAEKNREGYWKRQSEKKDEVIDQLTEALQTNYIDQGEDDSEKRIRNLEARDYVTQIREARSTLVADNQRAQSEIPVFNPSSPEFIGAEQVEKIMARYARDNVILKPIQLADGNISNEVVGYRQPLYAYLAEEADLLAGVSRSGQAKGQRANATMDAAAEVPGGTSPSSRQTGGEENDDFLKGFNSVK